MKRGGTSSGFSVIALLVACLILTGCSGTAIDPQKPASDWTEEETTAYLEEKYPDFQEVEAELPKCALPYGGYLPRDGYSAVSAQDIRLVPFEFQLAAHDLLAGRSFRPIGPEEVERLGAGAYQNRHHAYLVTACVMNLIQNRQYFETQVYGSNIDGWVDPDLQDLRLEVFRLGGAGSTERLVAFVIFSDFKIETFSTVSTSGL